MHYFLGVDMGTSSIKATLLDEEANILFTKKIAVQLINPAEGIYEIDPIKTWWQGFTSICAGIKAEVDLHSVKAVCVSSVCGSFVPVDQNFNPLYNAILYGIDTRAKKQVAFLNEKYGEEYLREHLGGLFNTHSVIPKFLWLKENYPDLYQECRYFVESNNFVTARLTGTARWDFPTAAGTRLVDFQTMNIPEKILSDNGLDQGKIPDFSWPTAKIGEVHHTAATATGLKAGTTVVQGACDINAEAMAIGAINPGDLVFVYGSTISSLLTIERYITLKGFNPGMSILENTYRLGGASSSGARFIDWMDQLIGESYSINRADLPTGILILPYLDGARVPFDNPLAKGVFFGVHRKTEKKDFYLAAREAIGYEVGLLLDKLNSVYPVSGTIKAMGGLTNDQALMQMISDITGKKQKVYKGIDASFGDALLALTTSYSLIEIDQLVNVRKVRNPSTIFTPDETMHQAYQPLVGKYNRLYENLKELF